MAEQDRDWQGVIECQPPLHQAVSQNDLALVKSMVKEGQSVNMLNSWGITPLRAAVKGIKSYLATVSLTIALSQPRR